MSAAKQHWWRISIGRLSLDLRVNSGGTCVSGSIAAMPSSPPPPTPHPDSNTRLPFSTLAEKQSRRLKRVEERSVHVMDGWRLITRRSGWQTAGGGGGGDGDGGGDLHIKGAVLPLFDAETSNANWRRGLSFN